MLNFEWKSLSNSPATLNDLKDTLIKNRNFDLSLINGETTIKEILQNPEKVGFEKNDVLTAVEIIKSVLSDEKGIVIHGDYDVDGITSSAILYELTQTLGIKDRVKTFLPNRFEHGYGFSNNSYGFIKESYSVSEYPLIILVDCGITSIETIAQAKKDGYKVIVIDHHQKKDKLPNADAIFWNDELTAAVLAFFFSKYIEIKVLGRTNLYAGIDLAGLGYIADLGNLSFTVGNIVTREGIKLINTSPRKGIKHILDSANKTPGNLTSYDLGWIVGPRLNSSGRMTDPTESLNLILGIGDGAGLAALLEDTNKDRQDITKELFEEAITGLSNRKFVGIDEDHKVVVAHSENFHEGVIGLISSKLVKSLYKPSICISWEGDMGKGSCRSVEGVSIVALLEKVSNLLEGFGGHHMAAGFSIKKQNYAEFEKRLLEISKTEISSDLLRPIYTYDCSVKKEFLNLELLEFIDRLEPFGNGNPAPLFVLNNIKFDDYKTVGKDGEHVSFVLNDTNVRGIFFGGSKYKEQFDNIDYFNILFSFEKNIWKGNVYPQIVVKDIKPSDGF